MDAYLVTGLAGLLTLGGGLAALRVESAKGLVYAFCAGVLIGTALLAMIPEALELFGAAGSADRLLADVAAGFFAFYLLENLEDLTGARRGDVLHHGHRHPTGLWAAAGIGVHGFVVGLALAGAFAAGRGLAWPIALGIVMHRIADGVAVAGAMRGTEQGPRSTLAMLVFASISPVAGVAVEPLFAIPGSALAIAYGWFAGVFLYLGATSLLPAAREASGSRWLPVAALAGIALVYAARRTLG